MEDDLASRRFVQTDHGPTGGRLATTALPDESEGLPFAHEQIDAVNGLDLPDGPPEQPTLDRKMLLQTTGFEKDRLLLAGLVR